MLNSNYDYEVDKDLLYRFYAKKTNNMKCYWSNYYVLIPHDLNNKLQLSSSKKVITSDSKGTYQAGINKPSKELKEAADFYYKEGAITQQVYNIIING